MRRTKILATLGPASSEYDVIERMIEAGLDGARLNFSHGTYEDHAGLAEMVREAAQEVGRPVSLVQDLQGPKIRVREVEEGEIHLSEGSQVRVDAAEAVGDAGYLPVDDPRVVEGVEVGSQVLLGDGEVALEVTEVEDDAFSARVVQGGQVRSGAGITPRGMSLPGGLTEKDQEDLLFGRKLGIDYVAISYVSTPDDVADAKELLAAKGESTPVIAKIERQQALDNIDGIVAASDGILVARGDLGIALPPEAVPVAQKRLLRLCNRRGVLSITATQMLESMVESPRPTRAEASDVSNAILDGSHVVMLSGETAIGVDPARAVGTMARIGQETEKAIVTGQMEDTWQQGEPDGSRSDAVAHAAVNLAGELGVEAIVSFTHSGSTALRVAKYRPTAPIIGTTPNQATCNRLALVWGVQPFLAPDASTIDELVWIAEDAAKAAGDVEPGDQIVLTAGEIGVPGTTNLVRVATVR